MDKLKRLHDYKTGAVIYIYPHPKIEYIVPVEGGGTNFVITIGDRFSAFSNSQTRHFHVREPAAYVAHLFDAL